MSTKKLVAKSAGIIMVGYTLSRILGYVRDKLWVYIFGQDKISTDAYTAAFSIPDLLYFLLAGGALSAAFIPVFTDYLTKGEKKEAWKIASSIANLLIILVASGIMIILIFADKLVPLIVPGYNEQTMKLAIFLTRIMCPAVLFFVLSALCSAILNSYQHFKTPAFAFIFYDVPIILGCLILGPKIGIVGMSLGVLIGAIMLVLLQLPVIIKMGWDYKFILNLSHPGVKRILKLFLPAMFGLLISQVNLFMIPQFFGSKLSSGVNTYLRLATRIIYVPLGIFAVAISTAIFPFLASQVSLNDKTAFRNTLTRGICFSFFLSLPSTAGVIVLSKPIIRVLFQGGGFKVVDVEKTSFLLLFLSIGLIGLSTLQVITRGFYANFDTKTPVKVGVISLFLNIFLCYFLTNSYLKSSGLGLAVSLTSMFNMSILIFIIHKKMKGIDVKRILNSFLKSVFVSIVMGLICHFIYIHLEKFLGISLKSAAFNLFLVMIIGILSYFSMAFLLRTEETKYIVEMLKERLKIKN